MCVCVCVCVYKVFFNPINPELGIIQSGQINHSNFEYLNIPGGEPNVNKFTEQIFLFKEKNNNRSHWDNKFISIQLRALNLRL